MSDLSFAERVLRTAIAELGSTDFVKYVMFSAHDGMHPRQPQLDFAGSKYAAYAAAFATWCVWNTWIDEDQAVREPLLGEFARSWGRMQTSNDLIRSWALPCVGHRNMAWEPCSDAETSGRLRHADAGSRPAPGDLLIFGEGRYDLTHATVCESVSDTGFTDIANVDGTVLLRAEDSVRDPLFGWVSL